ncbi:MAG: hypothetical protein MUE30_00200 [Spirosomaceae bacterium]|jgi:hypothetical protein|nr:hypothetical protein [Spirosomataceae bacterium]
MRIIIETQERHRNLFVEMAKAVKAKVKVEDETHPPSKEEFLDSLEKSYREAQLHAQGKIKLKTARELFNEL